MESKKALKGLKAAIFSVVDYKVYFNQHKAK